MIFEVLLLMISQEEKSKVLMDPDIFFNDLGDFDSGGGSYFGWFSKSKEEECTGGWWWPTLE